MRVSIEDSDRGELAGYLGTVSVDEVEVARALRLFFPISVCYGDSAASWSVCLLVVGWGTRHSESRRGLVVCHVIRLPGGGI